MGIMAINKYHSIQEMVDNICGIQPTAPAKKWPSNKYAEFYMVLLSAKSSPPLTTFMS